MDEAPWLEKIRGYTELGMLDEAWGAIEALTPKQSGMPEAQEARIIVMLERGELEEALELAEILRDVYPENHAAYVQGAWCLHAMGKTADAIEMLQSGPSSLMEEAVYYYNLACYELALGKPQAALTWLLQSFEMDPPSKAKALADPDLEPLRDEIVDAIG